MYFTWKLHYRCNFRCPYCPYFDRRISEGSLSKEDWVNSWNIKITGGEPFLYPSFVELITELPPEHFSGILDDNLILSTKSERCSYESCFDNFYILVEEDRNRMIHQIKIRQIEKLLFAGGLT